LLKLLVLLLLLLLSLLLIGEQLEDLLSTLHSLNATEMVRATETAGLQSSLATDNVTVFAPINAAFDALHQPTAVMPLFVVYMVGGDTGVRLYE